MSDHESLVRAYLRAIERGEVVGHESDWYVDDAVQIELPNRLIPSGATRDLAALNWLTSVAKPSSRRKATKSST